MKPLAIAALALGVTMLTAFAQPAPEVLARPEAQRQKGQDRLDRALNLTDAQKTSVKEIRAKHREGAEARQKAAQDARKAFRDAFLKPETKVEDLKALHQAAADAQLAQLLDQRAQRQEIRAILTPEQREKAAFLMGRAEGMGRWGGFRGRDAR